MSLCHLYCFEEFYLKKNILPTGEVCQGDKFHDRLVGNDGNTINKVRITSEKLVSSVPSEREYF